VSESERDMATRVCEYCYKYFNSASEIVAHYAKDHKEDSDDEL
jgi:hypothetical protein